MISQPARTLQNRQKSDLIGSVQRALRILELLAQHPEGLNAKQINRHLHLNISTCYHLLNTLLDSEYVVKDPDTLQFRLSEKFQYTALPPVSAQQIVARLNNHVQALQEMTQETAYLSLLDGQEIYIAAIVESPRSVRVKALTIGYSEANHASALGKSILAYLDEAQADHYLTGRDLPAYTPKTMTDPALIKQHLAQVRQQGYSLDVEEFLPDVYCIGAPIFDAGQQVVASIAISLPSTRYHTPNNLVTHVKQLAQAATRTLAISGYLRPSPIEAEL